LVPVKSLNNETLFVACVIWHYLFIYLLFIYLFIQLVINDKVWKCGRTRVDKTSWYYKASKL